ncbi:MAG: hypothetical protein JSV75_01735 [Candidatus Bathyarchaeota archaeon]|nr:MAG: hypothetical protein JSV75_01735 [Candidatus Bathyarchaeota archaeon]
MPEKIHTRFFAVLGLVLGALYGFIFSVWKPLRTAIIVDLYDPVMWAIAILSFFVLQFGLAVTLRKPNTTREIYFGMFLIPITYTASVVTLSIPDFLRTLIAVEVPALVLFLTSFYFVSPFVAFFAGVDTKVLDNAEIPAETIFSFVIQHSRDNLNLLKRIVNGIGLTISLNNNDEGNGLIICRKEKLHMGIFFESKDQVLTATFVPFQMANDTVKKVEDLDTIIDLKAQISGMLYVWMHNKIVWRFNELLPNVELVFGKVSKGLGPLEKPLTVHLRESVVSFPKNHPYRLALLTTGIVIIINIMLFILGRLVFK